MKRKSKPHWDFTVNDLTKYKLSKKEIKRKKKLMKSKNNIHNLYETMMKNKKKRKRKTPKKKLKRRKEIDQSPVRKKKNNFFGSPMKNEFEIEERGLVRLQEEYAQIQKKIDSLENEKRENSSFKIKKRKGKTSKRIFTPKKHQKTKREKEEEIIEEVDDEDSDIEVEITDGYIPKESKEQSKVEEIESNQKILELEEKIRERDSILSNLRIDFDNFKETTEQKLEQIKEHLGELLYFKNHQISLTGERKESDVQPESPLVFRKKKTGGVKIPPLSSKIEYKLDHLPEPEINIDTNFTKNNVIDLDNIKYEDDMFEEGNVFDDIPQPTPFQNIMPQPNPIVIKPSKQKSKFGPTKIVGMKFKKKM